MNNEIESQTDENGESRKTKPAEWPAEGGSCAYPFRRRARRGKIARLPRAVRDEVNQRLEDGQPGPAILAWLNGQPETQKTMQEEFGGKPISKQNLSEWRLGGFGDWVRTKEVRAVADRLLAGSPDSIYSASSGGPAASSPQAASAVAKAMADKSERMMENALGQTFEPGETKIVRPKPTLRETHGLGVEPRWTRDNPPCLDADQTSAMAQCR